MAAVDEKTARALREQLSELLVVLGRKYSEVSNLKVGYIRAVEGVGHIPAEPLKRNLLAARADMTELEQRVAAIRHELGDSDQVLPAD